MLVSILIATYNRLALTQKYLPEIINRIGDVEHEILIWDNGSTDGTLDWILEQQKIYPTIREVFFSHTNLGMPAFNALAKEAQGKYILKVDDDVVVPENFVSRLISAFESVEEPKLAYLGWDLAWGSSSFARRRGLSRYQHTNGKIVKLSAKDTVYISYKPSQWMVNGVCRLSLKETFLSLGGHPEGILYGADHHVSIAAEKAGYWVGFYNTKDLVTHHGDDSKEYRKFKDQQLALARAPRHV